MAINGTLVPRATLRGVAELHVASGMPQWRMFDLLLFLDENRVIPDFTVADPECSRGGGVSHILAENRGVSLTLLPKNA